MINLDDYIKDVRLSRLLKNKSGRAVLCLWILEAKSERVDYHLLYGRLLPTSFSNNKWSGSDGHKIKDFDGYQIRVLPITLTVNTNLVIDLIRFLLEGKTLSEISSSLNLGYVNGKFEKIIKDIKLSINAVFSPVSFLIPRNSIDSSKRRSLSSSTSCYSGLILNQNKITELSTYTKQKDEVFFYIINIINSECGMEFEKNDSFRLGALEISVIPNVDDYEIDNVSFEYCKVNNKFNLIINKELQLRTGKILCSLNVYSGGRVIYSNVNVKKFIRNANLNVTYDIHKDVIESAECYRVELSFYNSKEKSYVMFFKHEYRYIRSVSVNVEPLVSTRIIGQNWFKHHSSDENGIKRARKLGTVSQSTQGVINYPKQVVGTNFIDIENVSYEYAEKEVNFKTGDNFFEHYQEGNNHARLDFSEWYVKTIHNDDHEKVIIFDPYYEDAGLYLLVPKAKKGTEYIVFTTIKDSSGSKFVNDDVGEGIESSGNDSNNRMQNLQDTLINLSGELRGIKLSIYALPPISSGKPAFHDRYHLIQKNNGFTKGFHFSNSLQKANENYPLLITSMSDATVGKVTEYIDRIFEKIKTKGDINVSDYKIFDSTENVMKLSINDKFNYLYEDNSDEVVSHWTGENEVQGFLGFELVEKLKEKKIIENNDLQLSCFNDFSRLRFFLESSFSMEVFHKRWAIFCSILAHNDFCNDIEPLVEIKSDKIKVFLSALVKLESDSVSLDGYGWGNLINNDIEYFAKHSINFDRFLRDSEYKYSWSFRYALDYFLVNYPQHLIELFERNFGRLINGTVTTGELIVINRLLFKISFYLNFNLNEELIGYLIKSNVEILKWLGFIAISEESKCISTLDVFLVNLGCDKDTRFKCYTWLLLASRRRVSDQEIGYSDSSLYLPYLSWLQNNYKPCEVNFPLDSLVNILSGNLSKISWLEPAFSKEIALPLVADGVISYSSLSLIWFQEIHDLITRLLSPESGSPTVFSQDREGELLKCCIFYISNLSNQEIKEYINKLKGLVNKSARVIRKPLSRSVDWTSWDQATKAALLILSFCDGLKGTIHSQILELESLIKISRDLIKYRSNNEWFSMQTSGNEYAYLFR